MTLDLDLSDAPDAKPGLDLDLSDAPKAPAANAEPSDGEALDRYVADYNRRNPDSPITRADIPDRSGLWGSVEELGSGLKSAVLDQFPEDMARIWEGGDVSLDESSWARKLIREQEKDRSRRVLSRQVIEGDTWAKSLYQGPQSVATSAATGATGSVAGGAAGSAVPVVGTAAGAVVGAAAGSGVAFYRLAKNQFLHEVLSLAKGKKIDLTPEEWEGIKADVEDEAVKIGLWEAGPEALSQAFTVGLLKGAGGRVFGSVPGLSKITQAISKNALTRVGAKLAAEVGEEEVTEGMTYFGQEAIRKDVGLREDDPSLGEFVREQAGPVAVGSVLQIGGMGAVERAFGRGRKKGGDTGQEGQAAEQDAPAPEASAEAAQNAAPEAGPVETPAAEDVLPYTRADAEQDLVGRYGEADGKGLLGMFDALAESWAEREGRDPSEWFEKHLAGIVSEDRDRALGAEELGQGKELFQPSREDVRLADEALASDVASWAESVDALGERSSRDNMTMLNQTPLVLQMLGANSLSVQISPGKLSTAMEKHGLSPELVKQVPGAMADPIMVFRSATQGGDMVMMLELKDQHGGTVVVPITLEKETPGGYSANIATSIYGKTDQETRQPIDVWFARQIESGNLLYRNNKKSRDWARTSRLRLPGANSRAITAGQRIYTDADLVKLREANPTLYQSATESAARPVLDADPGQGPGIGLEAVRAVLAPLQEAAENAAPLEVVSDLAALPEHLRRDAAQGGGTPEAVLDPRSGTVYVLADAVRSPERAVALWLHEQGLHVGLLGLFGQDAARLDAFLDQTFEHFGAESFRELAEAHGLDLSTEDGRRRAAEERLAVLAEKVGLGRELDAAEQGLWDRVLEMVREWLRERGVDLGLRDADIARVVRDSVRWTMGDRRARGDERTLYQGAKLEQARKIGERVEREAKSWSGAVDRFLVGALNPSESLRVGSTPEVLQAVGAKALPLEMTQRKASKILRDKHHLPADILKALPRLLAEPVAVFDSATMANSLVVLTEARDMAGKPVIAAVHLAVREGHHEINEIASVYGKDGFSGWFRREVGDGRLRYIDKRKAASAAGSGELQLLKERTYRGGKQKILTETDIVKPILPDDELSHGGLKGTSPRAAVTFLDDGRALIRLFTSADPTSVIHEAGHVLRRMLDAGDTAVVEKWAGAEGGVWTREAEEKFARAFERYCYEGAAPTSRLRQVLSKLRNMLVRIYGNLKNLGAAEIPAEVRAVFDKMLSTEKERAAERELVRRIHSFAVDPDAREATYEEPPAHPADIREWGDLMAEAERRAQAHFDKERRKELRALRAEWRAEGKEVADNHPAHWVMDQVGGLDADSLARDYDAEFIRELSRKRPGLVRRGALAYDIALASVGVEDSDAMLTRILEAPTKAEIVKDWMERREAEWERMRTQAGDFGQEYFAVQDAALEILGQMTERRNDQFARAKAREAVDEMAAASLGKEAVRLRNERAKLNKAAAQAFESGDRVAAGATLRKLRESDYLLREVERARYERERILRSVSVSLARKIPEEFREQARAWAARLGYKGGAGDAGRSLLEFLSPRGLHHFVDQDAIRSLERAPAGALTMDQMRRARDVLRQIVYFGDTENKLLAGKEAQEFDRVLAQVVGSVLGNKKTAARAESVAHPAAPSARRESPLAGFLSGVRDAHAELLKPEFLFRSMDGFKEFGPVWEACYAPLKTAEDAELALGTETYARLREAFKPFEGEFRDWRRKRLTIKEVPRNVEMKSWRGGVTFKPGQPLRLTKEEILMVALNMGNTGNRNALKKGFMWTDGDLAAITSRLSREEWGLVERVWEIVDSLYPKLAETSRRISGAAPRKVAAEPFQARTSDGSEIEVRGGYFPLVFDRELSWKADRFAALAEDRDLFQNIYQQPKPAGGMTIERKGGTMAPLLSLEVLGRHVRDTAHYATHAAAVRDVQKIVADERFRSAVDRAYGDGTYRQLAPWLQHVAKPVREETSFVEKWVGRLRRNTSVVTMGLKVSTAMMQPLAFTQAVNELGFVPSMKGLGHFLAHPWRSVEFVNERSLAMRNRRRRWDREVADAYGKFNPAEFRGSRAVKDAFFGMMGFMDAMTAYPAWMAAYAKAMEEHGWDEAKACEFADMVVRRTQGAGGSPLDMARVQHGSELKKSLTMFYSFYSVFWNQFAELHARVGRGAAGAGDLFKGYWWLLVLPAVLGDWSHWGDYDDPEKALKRGGQAVAGYVLAGLPVLRDVVSPMLTGYGYRFSPVSDAAEAPVDLWRAMQARKDRPRKVAKAAIMAAGYFWGLPSRQAVIGMEGALDLMQGRTDNPARLLFPAPKEEKGKKRMTYGGGK